jgi:hypothetical protein
MIILNSKGNSNSNNIGYQTVFSKNDPRKDFILPYESPDVLFGLMTLTPSR